MEAAVRFPPCRFLEIILFSEIKRSVSHAADSAQSGQCNECEKSGDIVATAMLLPTLFVYK